MSRKNGMQITGKNVKVDNLHLDSSRLNIKGINIELSNFKSIGEYPKSVSNAAISLNTDGDVVVRNCDIAQTGYNCLEIGLSSAPKSVLIENVNFESALSNNAVLIFAHQENAEITIKNCIFQSVSNCLRISNRLNVPAVINIIDCECLKWDTDPTWAGFLIMQDYTSGSKETEQSNNIFHNLTFNISNLIGPNGKVLPDNVADIMPGGSGDQFAYIWNSHEQTVEYNEDRYPTFNFS